MGGVRFTGGNYKHALAEQMRNAQRSKWLRDNTDAVQEHTQLAGLNGTLSDSVRKF